MLQKTKALLERAQAEKDDWFRRAMGAGESPTAGGDKGSNLVHDSLEDLTKTVKRMMFAVSDGSAFSPEVCGVPGSLPPSLPRPVSRFSHCSCCSCCSGWGCRDACLLCVCCVFAVCLSPNCNVDAVGYCTLHRHPSRVTRLLRCCTVPTGGFTPWRAVLINAAGIGQSEVGPAVRDRHAR